MLFPSRVRVHSINCRERYIYLRMDHIIRMSSLPLHHVRNTGDRNQNNQLLLVGCIYPKSLPRASDRNNRVCHLERLPGMARHIRNQAQLDSAPYFGSHVPCIPAMNIPARQRSHIKQPCTAGARERCILYTYINVSCESPPSCRKKNKGGLSPQLLSLIHI